MGLPVRQGLSVLYVLADEWMWRRDLLALLGAKDPGRLDTALQPAAPAGQSAQWARVAAMGGEIG